MCGVTGFMSIKDLNTNEKFECIYTNGILMPQLIKAYRDELI